MKVGDSCWADPVKLCREVVVGLILESAAATDTGLFQAEWKLGDSHQARADLSVACNLLVQAGAQEAEAGSLQQEFGRDWAGSYQELPESPVVEDKTHCPEDSHLAQEEGHIPAQLC